jgi:hypothetical protein
MLCLLDAYEKEIKAQKILDEQDKILKELKNTPITLEFENIIKRRNLHKKYDALSKKYDKIYN